ncbi:hypothetical protein LY78DRAFT_152837 [Colletotrichum sublineola]|nr:hypothetical protein LY78DRAFT_152837 [Colletotrichum sublineola]
MKMVTRFARTAVNQSWTSRLGLGHVFRRFRCSHLLAVKSSPEGPGCEEPTTMIPISSRRRCLHMALKREFPYADQCGRAVIPQCGQPSNTERPVVWESGMRSAPSRYDQPRILMEPTQPWFSFLLLLFLLYFFSVSSVFLSLLLPRLGLFMSRLYRKMPWTLALERPVPVPYLFRPHNVVRRYNY